MKKYREFYKESIDNPEEFWKNQSNAIKWFSAPEKTLTKDEDVFYHWFEDGTLNNCYLAVDQHIENGRADQLALIYDSPVTGNKAKYTYKELLREVELVAGMLYRLGVGKGDRVIIYMPLIPQTIFSMLACARIGAIHSVVFGGFSANELSIRIDSAKPTVLLTASGGIEVEKVIPYKPLVDEAIKISKHKIHHVVVYQRSFITAGMKQSRDYDWEELLSRSEPVSYVKLKSKDPLYIIYTSGTTGKPKGVVRDNGGHAVAMEFSMKHIYGVEPGEVFWAASDVGWVVGHSYIVYAPLIHGCTTVLYEGKPIKTPDAGAFWRVISEYKVNVFFTAPTAFRAMVKSDPEGKLKEAYEMPDLKYIFLAGERCDVATLKWLQNLVNIPVIDHWWQTESGWPMIANMAGVELLPVKPGSAGVPVCGYKFEVFNSDGTIADRNVEGPLAIKYPLPPGNLMNLWKNTERFKNAYLKSFPGYFDSGDAAYIDDDGYIFITGRVDDIINVAGHRLSTATIEEVILAHPMIAECAVIGAEDQLKGQIPIAFVVVKDGISKELEEISQELIQAVRKQIGPVVSFKKSIFVNRLPKTRSGKILRKTIRAITDGKEYKIPSTIEDPEVLEEFKLLLEKEQINH